MACKQPSLDGAEASPATIAAAAGSLTAKSAIIYASADIPGISFWCAVDVFSCFAAALSSSTAPAQELKAGGGLAGLAK